MRAGRSGNFARIRGTGIQTNREVTEIPQEPLTVSTEDLRLLVDRLYLNSQQQRKNKRPNDHVAVLMNAGMMEFLLALLLEFPDIEPPEAMAEQIANMRRGIRRSL